MSENPCVKEKKYGWCKGERTYPTESGWYCVFHLPKGYREKGALVKKMVFEKIHNARAKSEKCDLSGTIFKEAMVFSAYNKDNPLPEIDFSYAVFCDDADFRDAVFEGDANFEWARFEGVSYFNSATFKKKADFSCTVFEVDAYFLYADFFEKADFTEIIFEEEAHFLKKTFRKGADFLATDTMRRIIFDQVDLRGVSLIDCDLRKVDFISCNFKKLEKGKIRVLYDELVARKMVSGDEIHEDKMEESPADKEKDMIERVEILYRRLKQKYLDERDYGQASEWHIREKEMLKKRTNFREFFSFILLRLYNWSSGYGENPSRALVVLFLMICATMLLLGIFGMSIPGHNVIDVQVIWSGHIDLSETGKLILSVFQYLTFQKDIYLKPANLPGEFVKLVSQILISLQTALFALAVRNRFRR